MPKTPLLLEGALLLSGPERWVVGGVILAACLALVLLLIGLSREGHEDAQGFHKGAPPAPEGREDPDRSNVA